jgi:uracil-DNA glycosylase
MNPAEKILKSLLYAGIEWELFDENNLQTLEIHEKNNNESFSVPKSTAPVSNESLFELAKSKAETCDICDGIKKFTEHPLYKNAKNTVLPQITECQLLVITDTPSLSDDSSGNILSGADGELFDKMLSAIGLDRKCVSITPLVFWRPAGGRTPTEIELKCCKPFIEKIIEKVCPKKILTLGAVAAQEIAGVNLCHGHGKWSGNIMPIFKPDFIIQNPDVKRDVWDALQTLANS